MPVSLLSREVAEARANGELDNSSGTESPLLSFRIEGRILLSRNAFHDQEDAKKRIFLQLKQSGIDSTILKEKDAEEGFQYHQIWIGDIDLGEDDANEIVSMRLGSKVYVANREFHIWVHDFLNIFEALKGYDKVPSILGAADLSNVSIHISLKESMWVDELDLLKRVAKAVIFFERCMDVLVPQNLLNDPIYRSNHASIFYQDMFPHPKDGTSKLGQTAENRADVEVAMKLIDEVEDYGQLVELICTTPLPMVDSSKPEWDNEFRWNFRPILQTDTQRIGSWQQAHQEISQKNVKSVQGTIEFRHPPSVDGEMISNWAVFAVCFVRSAIRPDAELKTASLEELQEFILEGADLCGFGDHAAGVFLADLFEGKLGKPPSKIYFKNSGYSIELPDV